VKLVKAWNCLVYTIPNEKAISSKKINLIFAPKNDVLRSANTLSLFKYFHRVISSSYGRLRLIHDKHEKFEGPLFGVNFKMLKKLTNFHPQ